MESIPIFYMQTNYNPFRAHYDLLIQLKLRSYLNQRSPPIREIADIQTESLHFYKGRPAREQLRGLDVSGPKKLMTDYAFYQDIIIKMHFIKEA